MFGRNQVELPGSVEVWQVFFEELCEVTEVKDEKRDAHFDPGLSAKKSRQCAAVLWNDSSSNIEVIRG